MVLRPVSGDSVKQDVPHMELVGIQRKTPDGFIVLDQERDVTDDAGGNRVREEVPHLAGIAAVTRYLELDLTDDPVTREFISTT